MPESPTKMPSKTSARRQTDTPFFLGLGLIGGLYVLLIFPENRGAALGGNNSVDGVFLHQDMVADCYPQSAAAPTLSDDADNDRNFQPGHFPQVNPLNVVCLRLITIGSPLLMSLLPDRWAAMHPQHVHWGRLEERRMVAENKLYYRLQAGVAGTHPYAQPALADQPAR